MIKYCKTCGLRHPRESICLLTKRKIDPTKDFCSEHRLTIHKCSICGNITLSPIIDEVTERIFCQNCLSITGTCAFCLNSSTCAFETDPSPLPKYIQKQIRRGNMVSVETVKNPERTEKFCTASCKCFDANLGCSRENKYCAHYQEEETKDEN